MDFLRSFVLAFAAIFLAGCATDTRLAEQPDPRAGTFLLKVVGVQRVSAFNSKWQTVTVADKRTGRKFEIADSASFGAGYSLFLGSLPEGDYEVAGLGAMGQGPGTFGVLPALIILAATSDAQSLESALGDFRIRAGTLTNLGVLVSALPESRTQTAKLALLADDRGRSDALADADPRVKARLAAMPTISWPKLPEIASPEKVETVLRESARNVAALETTFEGRVLIGSALGTVHERSGDGTWRSMSLGTLHTISYLRVLPDRRILAATDSGEYFLGSAEGRWTRHDLAGRNERVIYVEPMGPHGVALLTVSMHRPTGMVPLHYRLYVARNLDEGGSGKAVVAINDFPAVGIPVLYNGRELQLYFNHQGIARKADLYRVDPVTLEVKVDKVDYWASEVYRLPDQGVVLHRMNGLTTYPSFSSDGGVTWRHDQKGMDAAIVRYVSPTKAYGFIVKATGWTYNTMGLVKLADADGRWQDQEVRFEGAGLTPVRMANGRLYVASAGKLLSSTDEGKTWTTEWPAP